MDVMEGAGIGICEEGGVRNVRIFGEGFEIRRMVWKE